MVVAQELRLPQAVEIDAIGGVPETAAGKQYQRIFGDGFKPGADFWGWLGQFQEISATATFDLASLPPELRAQFTAALADVRQSLGVLVYTMVDELANSEMLKAFGLPRILAAIPVFMNLAKSTSEASSLRARAADEAQQTMAAMRQIYIVVLSYIEWQQEQTKKKQVEVQTARQSIAAAETAAPGVRPVGAQMRELVQKEETSNSAIGQFTQAALYWVRAKIEKVTSSQPVVVWQARRPIELTPAGMSVVPMAAS